MSRDKKIRHVAASDSKHIRTLSEAKGESTDNHPPMFSLRYMDDKYCVSNCEQDEKAAFADRLRILSRMSWKEIKLSHKHGLGTEKIDQRVISGSIPAHIMPDVDILAFRFSGKKPMVGYREMAVFYIIWLDRDFTLYPHG